MFGTEKRAFKFPRHGMLGVWVWKSRRGKEAIPQRYTEACQGTPPNVRAVPWPTVWTDLSLVKREASTIYLHYSSTAVPLHRPPALGTTPLWSPCHSDCSPRPSPRHDHTPSKNFRSFPLPMGWRASSLNAFQFAKVQLQYWSSRGAFAGPSIWT